jgi:hypothetical protein
VTNKKINESQNITEKQNKHACIHMTGVGAMFKTTLILVGPPFKFYQFQSVLGSSAQAFSACTTWKSRVNTIYMDHMGINLYVKLV